ncbi:MAG: hypothetical protein QG568_622 [Patescibacteria group bacterium]|nr:hypothetical protein [Patescibacteria group bacterium]
MNSNKKNFFITCAYVFVVTTLLGFVYRYLMNPFDTYFSGILPVTLFLSILIAFVYACRPITAILGIILTIASVIPISMYLLGDKEGYILLTLYTVAPFLLLVIVIALAYRQIQSALVFRFFAYALPLIVILGCFTAGLILSHANDCSVMLSKGGSLGCKKMKNVEASIESMDYRDCLNTEEVPLSEIYKCSYQVMKKVQKLNGISIDFCYNNFPQSRHMGGENISYNHVCYAPLSVLLDDITLCSRIKDKSVQSICEDDQVREMMKK